MRRRGSENGEERRRDLHRECALSLAFFADVVADLGIEGDVPEGFDVLSIIEVSNAVHRARDVTTGVAVVDADDSIRLCEGKRIEQDRVHHAEHGRVGADRDPDRGQQREGEARAPQQGANPET